MSGWHPRNEAEAVGAQTVLIEWLAATGRRSLGQPADLRAWARGDPTAFRAAFCRFAGVPPGLADAAAGWLLGAGLRPDDRVLWQGDPADPCLAALRALGGTLATEAAEASLVFARPPRWPGDAQERAPG
jgi:hypothetical protein